MFTKNTRKRMAMGLAAISLFTLSNIQSNASENNNATYNQSQGSNNESYVNSWMDEFNQANNDINGDDALVNQEDDQRESNNDDLNKAIQEINTNDIDKSAQEIVDNSKFNFNFADQETKDLIKKEIEDIIAYNMSHQAKMGYSINLLHNRYLNNNTYSTVDSKGDTVDNSFKDFPPLYDKNNSNNMINGKKIQQIINNKYFNKTTNSTLLYPNKNNNKLLVKTDTKDKRIASNNKVHYSILVHNTYYDNNGDTNSDGSIASINGTTDLNHLENISNQRLPDGYHYTSSGFPITLIKNKNDKQSNQPSYYLNTSIEVISNNEDKSNNGSKKINSPSASTNISNNDNYQSSTNKVNGKTLNNYKATVKNNQKQLKNIKKQLQVSKDKNNKVRLNKKLKQAEKVFAKSEVKYNHAKHNMKYII